MRPFCVCLSFVFALLCSSAKAGVVMLGTRVIYPEGDSFVQARFDNKDARTHLMQVWVDDGRGSPQTDGVKIPFAVTPPIFKIKGQSQQTVRIVVNKGAGLATDRETLYWFNFLQIPPENKDKKNEASRVNLAFLNQVKLIYRPEQIVGRVETLPNDLRFSLKRNGKGWRLTATNPTGYYATFINAAAIQSGGQRYPITLQPDVTLAPFSSLSWNLNLKIGSLKNPRLDYRLINDKGAAIEGSKAVDG